MKYQKFNIDFCKKYAITKKGLCLSKVYTTSHQKLLWQCNKGQISEKRSYRPDAYLVKENKWIEIKGFFREYSKEKWDWFHEKYPNSELWDRKKLEEIGILSVSKKGQLCIV